MRSLSVGSVGRVSDAVKRAWHGRFDLLVVVLALAAVGVADGVANNSRAAQRLGASNSPPQTASVSSAVAKQAAASPDGPSLVLTGIGATDADWDRTHVQKARAAKGATPGRSVVGMSKYASIWHGNGRIVYYQMRYAPPGLDAAVAKFDLGRDLPPDAKLLKDVRQFGCEQLLYQSATIHLLLGQQPFGFTDGLIQVGMSSVADRYNTYQVTEIDVLLAVTPDFPAC